MRLFDAACATSAAPAFWQLKCTPHPCHDDGVSNMIENPEGPDKPSICVPASGACEHLIDGGVVQNNPSIYAMSTAMMIADARKLAGGSDIARPVRLISIGTGGSPAFDRIK
jgi:patatin-like phospholipase/acyl hydrolase